MAVGLSDTGERNFMPWDWYNRKGPQASKYSHRARFQLNSFVSGEDDVKR